MEEEIGALEKEISDPETASDFQRLNEKCMELEEKKEKLNQAMDEWIELSEE